MTPSDRDQLPRVVILQLDRQDADRAKGEAATAERVTTEASLAAQAMIVKANQDAAAFAALAAKLEPVMAAHHETASAALTAAVAKLRSDHDALASRLDKLLAGIEASVSAGVSK